MLVNSEQKNYLLNQLKESAEILLLKLDVLHLFIKYIMIDYTVVVTYNWVHPDHEPVSIEEIIGSRLP